MFAPGEVRSNTLVAHGTILGTANAVRCL